MTEPRRDEIQKMFRVADQLISCHTKLRDSYSFWSSAIDISILTLSVWLVALAFAQNSILSIINPTPFPEKFFIGTIAVFTFVLSLVQMKIEWKKRSADHEKAVRNYFEIKHDLGGLLASPIPINDSQFDRSKEQYAFIGKTSIPVPEHKFLKLKRYHLLKVFVSKYLDDHPGTSISFLRLKIFLRDNCRRIQ